MNSMQTALKPYGLCRRTKNIQHLAWRHLTRSISLFVNMFVDLPACIMKSLQHNVLSKSFLKWDLTSCVKLQHWILSSVCLASCPQVSLGLIHGKASHIIWPPNRWQRIEQSLPPERGPLLNWNTTPKEDEDWGGAVSSQPVGGAVSSQPVRCTVTLYWVTSPWNGRSDSWQTDHVNGSSLFQWLNSLYTVCHVEHQDNKYIVNLLSEFRHGKELFYMLWKTCQLDVEEAIHGKLALIQTGNKNTRPICS